MVDVGRRGALNGQQGASRRQQLQGEGLIDVQLGIEGINKIAATCTIVAVPDGDFELLVLLQQVVVIGAPQLGNSPIEVINGLVLVNVVDDHLVGTVGSCQSVVAGCVRGRFGEINRFAAEHIGYNETYLLDAGVVASSIGFGDNAAPQFQGALDFLQPGEDSLLALLGGEQAGGECGGGEDGRDYDEGN